MAGGRDQPRGTEANPLEPRRVLGWRLESIPIEGKGGDARGSCMERTACEGGDAIGFEATASLSFGPGLWVKRTVNYCE